MTRRLALSLMAAGTALTACGDPTGSPQARDPSETRLRAFLFITGVMPPVSDTGDGALAMRIGQGDPVVYVSLSPSTIPDGRTATIENRRTREVVSTAVISGGFDPVPIAAVVGDMLHIAVSRDGGGSVHTDAMVESGRPPRVVRTNPPRGATDVPVNRVISVVFSDPIDEASVVGDAIVLYHGTTRVAGAARVQPNMPFVVDFVPAEPLQLDTEYRFVVGESIRNIVGIALDFGIAASFTTREFETEPLSFASISAGRAVCALTYEGQAYCWGNNEGGQIGDGSLNKSSLPTPVLGGLRFKAIHTSTWHTCGLTAAGEAWCWGSNSRGQLGNGSFANSLVPVRAAPGLLFESISVGAVATCGIVQSGDAWCWGAQELGILGGDTSACPVTGCADPIKVSGGHAFTALSVSQWTACALTLAGETFCWGANHLGELGLGDTPGPDMCPSLGFSGYPQTSCSRAPVPVSGGLQLASISAPLFSVCGLDVSGGVWCWGANNQGQFGNGSSTQFNPNPRPAPAAGGMQFRELHMGNQWVCGLALDNTPWCWGTAGLVGSGGGTPAERRTPTPVPGAPVFTTMSAGASAACGLTASGAAYCWGRNGSGQLGNGTLTDSYTPVAVRGP